MKRLVFVAVLVCSAGAACNKREDPVAVKKWGIDGPRLSSAESLTASCSDKVDNREKALSLLTIAQGADCLDKAVAAVEQYAKDDLSAAYYIRAERNDDPVDFLEALDAASSNSDIVRFNRALVQEKLGLTQQARLSWNEVVRLDPSPEWKDKARTHLQRLNAPVPRWSVAALDDALSRRDVAAVRGIATAFPSDTMGYFEVSGLEDLQSAKLLADVLAETGDPYARAILDATVNTKDRIGLEDGLHAFATKDYARAAVLLKRAGNPLHLSASYRSASATFVIGDALRVLESIGPVAAENSYRDLWARIQILRANALEQDDRHFQALEVYQKVLASTKLQTRIVDARARRSANYATTGNPKEAFRDAWVAMSLLPVVANLNSFHHACGTAARAARDLGFPAIALQFNSTGIERIKQVIVRVRGDELRLAKHYLAIALRERADIEVQMGRNADAEADLRQASELATAANPAALPLLRMRLAEVRGNQALAAGAATEAVKRYTDAINLAPELYSTYRANLHYKRALARGADPASDEDLALALEILREEGAVLRGTTARGDHEDLWRPYFSRFRELHQQLIERRLAQRDERGAFIEAEQARAFEPMQLLLQAPVPPGFRKLATKTDLQQTLASLPADTLILQYLVLEDHTYSWALSHDRIEWSRHSVGRKDIERWVDSVHESVAAGQNGPMTAAMRAAYDRLFSVPLSRSRHTRIVIVPDGPMHGLPFAALESATEGYLIRRSSIAVAGSMSLYLYALERDSEFSRSSRPSVLIVGEPAMDPAIAKRYKLGRLTNAMAEARELRENYDGAVLLEDSGATTDRFLDFARNATIIHFAGHGVANSRDPWLSMLVLASQGEDAGDLTAQKLLTRLDDLGRTRLIVLAACSTASGESIGVEGLAPLVRPLIAARVPAVVGTLWDVKDTATTKDLVVSLHRHYRNGDDVAVALQQAQLEMLRKNKPARTWAPLQVIGYAASPYAHHAAQEEKHSELHRQNSVHRPDGLHPQ